jgi:hypothetical protein
MIVMGKVNVHEYKRTDGTPVTSHERSKSESEKMSYEAPKEESEKPKEKSFSDVVGGKGLDLSKDTLTEQEVNLLMRRINDKKIKPQDVPHIQDGEGYKLTAPQIAKAKAWLMNLWKTPTGKEKENSPLGWREQQILEKMTGMRLKDVYSGEELIMCLFTKSKAMKHQWNIMLLAVR